MGKGAKPQIEVNKYHLSQHFGICAGPIDAILGIIVKEKQAWTGRITALSQFAVDKGQLFGGEKKEGGFKAVANYLPGDDDQLLSDYLAQKLGRAGGTDCPGYRGLASIFFTGPRNSGFSGPWNSGDSFRNQRGAYWSANNPYLPGVWVTVERAPKGLLPEIALVPRTIVDPGDLIETVELEDTFPNLFRFDVGYPEPGTLYPATLTLGPYGTDAQVMVGASDIAADDQFVLNGVDGTWKYLNYNVVGAIPEGEVWTLQVRNIFHNDCAAQGTLEVYPIVRGIDANPAHIIFESLTNTDWGMGSPETAIDIVSFETAAVTLYGELFGLSMIWTRQASIQDFIQEVLDHIQAVLFVDPATGMLTLKLIRGDYNVDTLDDINPTNADLTNFGRKLWGEIVNEVVVTWTNPENEQEETVVVQDLASIVTQGGIISDGRNYYGVRYSALAQRLAQRDLRSAGAPLASCEAEVDRTLWEVRPASVYTVTWPEYGLAGVVMRVTDVSYGKPGDPKIKLTLVEDVFGLDVGDYIEPPGSIWEDPSSEPDVLDETLILTLPYFLAAQSSASVGAEYPEVLAGVFGSTDNIDTFNYELWDEVTLPDASVEWQPLATENVIGRAELVTAWDAEAETTFDETTDLTEIFGQTSPTQGGFVLIGDVSEAESEIALVTADGASVAVTRGVLDTVPKAWPVGTPVWFIDDETLYRDPLVRAAGEVVSYRMLTRTSQGQLDLDDAPDVSATLTERPWLPSRPANITIDSVKFNTSATPVDMIGESVVPVTWANRNRVTEDSLVLSWTDGNVTPETDQTTTITLYELDGVTVIDTITGLTGTSHDIPVATFAGASIALVSLSSERTDADGTFASLQTHGIWVQVEPHTFDSTTITFDSTLITMDEG